VLKQTIPVDPIPPATLDSNLRAGSKVQLNSGP